MRKSLAITVQWMFYLIMAGMPPYNTAVIDLNGADANFFKIRVDNLADEVR